MPFLYCLGRSVFVVTVVVVPSVAWIAQTQSRKLCSTGDANYLPRVKYCAVAVGCFAVGGEEGRFAALSRGAS